MRADSFRFMIDGGWLFGGWLMLGLCLGKKYKSGGKVKGLYM